MPGCCRGRPGGGTPRPAGGRGHGALPGGRGGAPRRPLGHGEGRGRSSGRQREGASGRTDGGTGGSAARGAADRGIRAAPQAEAGAHRHESAGRAGDRPADARPRPLAARPRAARCRGAQRQRLAKPPFPGPRERRAQRSAAPRRLCWRPLRRLFRQPHLAPEPLLHCAPEALAGVSFEPRCPGDEAPEGHGTPSAGVRDAC
mmetsp:Transcript_17033/g.53328  ORF Transcript_17033/g.53328 Transcript_17033/m.53328 type:complete len:202 (-) Transcript_17033:423-1028(-)